MGDIINPIFMIEFGGCYGKNAYRMNGFCTVYVRVMSCLQIFLKRLQED